MKTQVNSLKIKFNKMVKRTVFPATYEEFQTILERSFGISDLSKHRVTYRDEEGDNCLVSNSADFNAAAKYFQSFKTATILVEELDLFEAMEECVSEEVVEKTQETVSVQEVLPIKEVPVEQKEFEKEDEFEAVFPEKVCDINAFVEEKPEKAEEQAEKASEPKTSRKTFEEVVKNAADQLRCLGNEIVEGIQDLPSKKVYQDKTLRSAMREVGELVVDKVTFKDNKPEPKTEAKKEAKKAKKAAKDSVREAAKEAKKAVKEAKKAEKEAKKVLREAKKAAEKRALENKSAEKKADEPVSAFSHEELMFNIEQIVKEEVEKSNKKLTDKIMKRVSKIVSVKKPSVDTVHHGIICDGCETQNIKGFRYKCLECPDFDVCEGCEENIHETHPHNFIKVRKPLKRNDCFKVIDIDMNRADKMLKDLLGFNTQSQEQPCQTETYTEEQTVQTETKQEEPVEETRKEEVKKSCFLEEEDLSKLVKEFRAEFALNNAFTDDAIAKALNNANFDFNTAIGLLFL